MADLRGQHDRKKQKTKKKKSKQRENRGMPQQAASTQAGVKRKHSSTKLQGLVPVVPQSSVHARRARAIEERASARAARNEASERERARLEDAAAAVALDFDALDGLSWMPKVAARGTSSEQRQKYTLSTDDATMDFKPRPPKLGIGAKAASASSSAAEDTGLRKVRACTHARVNANTFVLPCERLVIHALSVAGTKKGNDKNQKAAKASSSQ